MQGASGTLDVIADDLRAVAVTGRRRRGPVRASGRTPAGTGSRTDEHFAAAEGRLRITCCQPGHHLPLLNHVAGMRRQSCRNQLGEFGIQSNGIWVLCWISQESRGLEFGVSPCGQLSARRKRASEADR